MGRRRTATTADRGAGEPPPIARGRFVDDWGDLPEVEADGQRGAVDETHGQDPAGAGPGLVRLPLERVRVGGTVVLEVRRRDRLARIGRQRAAAGVCPGRRVPGTEDVEAVVATERELDGDVRAGLLRDRPAVAGDR